MDLLSAEKITYRGKFLIDLSREELIDALMYTIKYIEKQNRWPASGLTVSASSLSQPLPRSP